MDNMENKGQGMVTSTARGGLPPVPQHTQSQARRILGIQDQGMVTERRHSNHEDQEILRMLGENYLRCTNRDSGINYGGDNDTTTQCRERCIDSWLGRQRKVVLVGNWIRTSGDLRFWRGIHGGGWILQWQWSSVTSVPCNGTPLHHYRMNSCKNNGLENPAR